MDRLEAVADGPAWVRNPARLPEDGSGHPPWGPFMSDDLGSFSGWRPGRSAR
jgi:hypothetical protein